MLLESEEIWDEVRERYVRERGGRYDAEAQRAMMGMSSKEWSRFIHEQLGVEASPAEINADVVDLMIARYREHVPLMPGAREAVERMAAVFPLAIASSSNRPLIAVVLELARAQLALPGNGVLRGGSAREADAGRVPRSGAASRRRAQPMRRR